MPTDDALTELQERLGYRFKDPELLRRALSHRSWIEERAPGGRAPAHQNQQRLEFLGDALLGYVVGRWIYDQLPMADEGVLTIRRTDFTKGEWLSARGASLGLDHVVRLGRGEAANDANRKLLEDTTEAILGAILLDGGDEAAVRVLQSWLPAELPPPGPRNPISAFNEWFQARFRRSPPKPTYSSTGAQHTQTWSARREIDGVEFEGTGANHEEANRALCTEILAALPDAG
jgi:ribonuclease-3